MSAMIKTFVRKALATIGLLVAATPGMAEARQGFARDLTCGRLPGSFCIDVRQGALIERVPPSVQAAQNDRTRVFSLSGSLTERGTTRQDILLLSAPQTEAALNRIVTRLLTAWPHPAPGPVRVKITADPAYGAHAYADGTIVLNSGMFDRANSEALTENELAFVLAHELAHILLNHHEIKPGQRRNRQALRLMADITQKASVLGTLRFDFTENLEVNVDNDGARDIQSAYRQTVYYHNLIRDTIDLGYASPMNRRQEDEADVLAVDLLFRAGYSTTDGFAKAVGNLSKGQEFKDALVQDLHKNLEDELNCSVFNEQVFSMVLGGESREAIDGVLGSAKSVALRTLRRNLFNFLNASHRTADVRMRNLHAYAAAVYPDHLPGNLPTRAFEDIARSPESRQFQTLVDRLRLMIQPIQLTERECGSGQRRQGGLPTISLPRWGRQQQQPAEQSTPAPVQVDPAIIAARREGIAARVQAANDLVAQRSPFAREPGVMIKSAEVFGFAGNTTLQRQWLERSVSVPGTPPEAYRKLLRFLSEANDRAGFARRLTEAKGKYNEPSFFLPEDILLAKLQNNEDRVAEVLEQCTALDEESISNLCVQYANEKMLNAADDPNYRRSLMDMRSWTGLRMAFDIFNTRKERQATEQEAEE